VTAGLLDTSVVVDLRRYAHQSGVLPDMALVSAITLAEIVQAPLFATNASVRRARERLVLDVHRAFPEPLPFDMACVAAYRSVAAATVDAGRQTRRRTVDLLIAATAHAHGLPLYTRNRADIDHLADLIQIIVPGSSTPGIA